MSNSSDKPYRTNAMRLENLSTSVLIICSATLFGLSTLKPEDLDISLNLALGCFAFALPASALSFMIKLEREHFGKPLISVINFEKCLCNLSKSTNNSARYGVIIESIFTIVSIGLVAGGVGITFLFLHFSMIHAVIFIISSLFFGGFYVCLLSGVDEEISKESEPPPQNNSENPTQ